MKQVEVVWYLANLNRPVTAKELCEIADESYAAVHSVMNRLVKDGILARRRRENDGTTGAPEHEYWVRSPLEEEREVRSDHD